MFLNGTKILSWLSTGKKLKNISKPVGNEKMSNMKHNVYDESKHLATSTIEKTYSYWSKRLPDMVYFMPCPKSSWLWYRSHRRIHLVGSGNLPAVIPVFSFSKCKKQSRDKTFDGDYDGIPVLKIWCRLLHGEVCKTRSRPLHNWVWWSRQCLYFSFRFTWDC